MRWVTSSSVNTDVDGSPHAATWTPAEPATETHTDVPTDIELDPGERTSINARRRLTRVLFVGAAQAAAFGLSGINNRMSFLAAVVGVFILGWLLTRLLTPALDSIEMIAIASLAGLSMLLLSATALALLGAVMDRLSMWVLVVVTSLLLSIAPTSPRTADRPKAGAWLAALLVVGIPLLLLGAALSTEFFMGYDPYAMATYSGAIATDTISPIDFPTAYVNHSGQFANGAYYLVAGASKMSGVGTVGLTRFGPVALLAFASLLLFVIVRAVSRKVLPGVVAAVLFGSAPFVLNRFSMLIRENVAIVFWLGLLVVLLKMLGNRSRGFALLAALFAAAALATHPAAAVLALASWALFLGIELWRGQRRGLFAFAALWSLAIVALSMPFSALLAHHYATAFVPAQAQAVAGTLPEDSQARFIWTRALFVQDFNLAGIVLAPLGLLWLGLRRRFVAGLVILGPIAGLALSVLALSYAGAQLPVVRSIVYLAIGAALAAGFGAAFLTESAYKLAQPRNPNSRTALGSWRLAIKRNGQPVSAVGAIAQGIVVGSLLVVIVVGAITIGGYRKGSPFNRIQVDAAHLAGDFVRQDPGPIVAPNNEVVLLLFAGLPGVVSDVGISSDFLTANRPEMLEAAVHEASGGDGPVYFYGSRKYLKDGVDISEGTKLGLTAPVTLFNVLRQINPKKVKLGKEPTSAVTSRLCVEQVKTNGGFLYRLELTGPDCPKRVT